MSNQKSMAEIHSIEALHASGHSNREIARLLSIDRGTVNKYVARLTSSQDLKANQNRPNAPTGSSDPQSEGAASIVAEELMGSEPTAADVQNRPNAPPGLVPTELPRLERLRSGSRSRAEPYRELIQQKLEQGLSATRIHQDLKHDHSAEVSYYSVLRMVRKLESKVPLPFRRMETSPGEEAQIDFGTGAWVIGEDGKKRRPWMFRIVLSHSRKAYSEAVWHQSTDNFIAAIENALHYFGGVPKRLVIDNLKAAVKRADWYDPELHPKLQSFAAHYGTTIVPTKPYRPEHKGKVESSVKYAKNNALKGHIFKSLADQNEHLLDWEATVADTRIHGTTKKQVRLAFEQVEKPTLLELPPERFAMFSESRRVVSRDGHIEVAKSFYSAPAEYISRTVWVRWDTHMVRIFNHRWEQIAVHSRAEPGRFRTNGGHVPAEKVSAVERGTDALLRQIAAIGPHAKSWSQAMLAARGVEGIRVLVGLKALAGRHRSDALEQACKIAVSHSAWRLKTIRNLLQQNTQQPEQQHFDFIEEHPIIRPLSDYSIESLNQFRRPRDHERQT